MELKSQFLLGFLFFCGYLTLSVRSTPDCRVNNADGTYWDFNLPATNISIFVTPMDDNDIQWSFLMTFCGDINNVGEDIVQSPIYYTGWNMGFLTSFQTANKAPSNEFYQEYTGGDRGYPCLSGRMTKVNVYCDGCPAGSTCFNGTKDFCICGAKYDDNPTEADPCIANLNVSVTCPTSPSNAVTTGSSTTGASPPPSSSLTGGQIFGIVLLVFFILTLVACILGFVYNQKVNNRRGKEAIPGYIFFSKEQSGMSKFSGNSYQRTTSENQYGAL